MAVRFCGCGSRPPQSKYIYQSRAAWPGLGSADRSRAPDAEFAEKLAIAEHLFRLADEELGGHRATSNGQLAKAAVLPGHGDASRFRERFQLAGRLPQLSAEERTARSQ
jgi:hypothetical protein